MVIALPPESTGTVPQTPTETRTELLERLADELAGAEASRDAIAPLTARYPDLTVADAYGIQEINASRRVAAGESTVGRKVGLTSLAMQRQLGVDEPDFGTVLDRMVIGPTQPLLLKELIAPRVEAEIAVRLGRDLAGPDIGVGQVRDAVDEVLLAIEVIDSRIADWKIKLVDTIADNASSARIAVGPGRPADPRLLDALPDVRLELAVDGEPAAEGMGAAVLGDPLRAVAWLARRLSGLGAGLRAGDVVLAGAVHASIGLCAGTRLRVTAPHLEPVEIAVG